MADGGIILEKPVVFANSAPLNTVLTLPVPANGHGSYRVTVYNPSTVTDLAVVALVTEPQFAAEGDHDISAKTFTATKNSTTGQAVSDTDGWITGSTPGKITLKNTTILGGSDGFTAIVRVRRI